MLNAWLARIKIAIDKLQRNGELLYYQHANGKFYVRYNDGKKSAPFDYKTAKDYADIFGGKVIHKKTETEC